MNFMCGLVVPILPSYRDQLLLSVPKTKRKLRGDRAFAVAAIRMWNDLPLHIRQTTSLSVFKSLLKTHLFDTT